MFDTKKGCWPVEYETWEVKDNKRQYFTRSHLYFEEDSKEILLNSFSLPVRCVIQTFVSAGRRLDLKLKWSSVNVGFQESDFKTDVFNIEPGLFLIDKREGRQTRIRLDQKK